MPVESLNDCVDLTLASPERIVHRRSNTAAKFATVVAGLLGYAVLTGFLLSYSMVKVYGFPISLDIRTRIEMALEACPMLAAILMVLIAPTKASLTDRAVRRIISLRQIWSRRMRRTLGTVLLNALFALAILAVTASALWFVCRNMGDPPAPMTLLWVAGEFTLDVFLIGIFTTALYALTSRFFSNLLLFTGYVVFVVLVGSRYGITSYIGFGSGVPVMLTTYSDSPLYDSAGWLFRGYWACIALFLLTLLYGFSRRGEPLLASLGRTWLSPKRRKYLYISSAAFLMCIAAGLSLFQLQRYGIAKYQAAFQRTRDAAWEKGTSRLHLSHFNLHLSYSSDNKALGVDALLSFVNSKEQFQTAYFEAPALVNPDEFTLTGGGKYDVDRSGRSIRIRFENALPAGHPIEIRYSGTIKAAGPFDLTVQAKVLRSGFFLNDSDVLLAARSGSCLASLRENAGPAATDRKCAGENYLMTDMANGQIIVDAPRELTVTTAGEASVSSVGSSSSRHVFQIAAPRLATFMVACAPFVESTLKSQDGGTTIHVYDSRASADGGISQAALAMRILSFYRTVWPADSQPELQIIETPTPLGEAVAFDGAVTISDKIITSRDPVSGLASNLLEFVMAHEIAHQWFGYQVIPARSPGRLFLLESFPQFAAYEYLAHRGILQAQQAMQNEKRRYENARARLGHNDVPLAQLEVSKELAYNKGPFVLLSLDALSGGTLMNRLGNLIQTHSHDVHGNTDPTEFIAKLIEQLPDQQQERARTLLYKPGL